jgi:hypothetical protein
MLAAELLLTFTVKLFLSMIWGLAVDVGNLNVNSAIQ